MLNLFRDFAREGELTEAKFIRSYLKKLECRNALGYYEKGYVMNEFLEYEKAIKAFNKAIELKPNCYGAYVYYIVGKNLKAVIRYEEAIKAFDKAIELEPNLSKAYFARG